MKSVSEVRPVEEAGFRPWMRRHPGALPATVGLLGAFLALCVRRMGDFDLPWHLAFGRALVQARGLLRVDPISFTHPTIPYVEFVSDAALYIIWKAGGELGLQVFGAACVVLIALVLYRNCRAHGAIAWVVVALAVGASSSWLLVRPATVSFALLALWMLLIDEHRRAPEQKHGRWALAALVPLQVLWINVHGFAIIALGLLWAYALYRLTCHAARGKAGAFLPQEDAGHWAFALAVAGAVTLATGVNMAGFRVVLGPLQASADFSRVTEWARPDLRFLVVTEPAVGFFALVTAAALVLGRSRGSRLPSAMDLGVVAVALFLGRSAVRMLPVAAILVAPVVARRLQGTVQELSRTRVLAALSTWVLAPLFLILSHTDLGVGFEPSSFPEQAVQFVERTRPAGRMWNFLPFGGYLEWRLWPTYEGFVDGRSAWVHSRALLDRAQASEHDEKALESLAQEHGMEWAVSRAAEGELFGAALSRSPLWQMVYLDDVAAVYVRRAGPNAGLSKKGYRVLRHLTPPELVLERAVQAGNWGEDLRHDGDLAAAQAPRSARSAFLQACGALAVRDFAAFEVALERLGRILPAGDKAPDALRRAAGVVRGQ